MAISLSEVKPFLLTPKLDDRKLASILEKIKVMYTIDRKGLPSKKWSRDEVSAYAAFYLTTNAVKFEWAMDQLTEKVRQELSECDVIDFGTGPGTYLLAFNRYFSDAAGTMIGVDKEELMLDQAHELVKGLFPQGKFQFTDQLPSRGSTRKRLLIFGNSCNELSTKEINDVIEKINADFVLFIEPGTPVVYDQIMDLRESFKKKGFSSLYPCPSLDFDCPVKKRVDEGKEDWCHQVWRGTHDHGVERLGQLAKIDRKAMPMIIHLYSRESIGGQSAQDVKARFIRYLNETKYAFSWEVCLQEEGTLKVCHFEIMKKGLSKKEQKAFKKLSVGQNFNFEVLKKISDEHYRVSVTIEAQEH